MRKIKSAFVQYFSLILWIICAGLVGMTFFTHIPTVDGKWIVILGFCVILNLFRKRKTKFRWKKFRIFTISILIFSFIFTFFNFWFGMAELGLGNPEEINGAYYQVSYDGLGTKLLSENEYHRLRRVEQRFYAGHLLSFAALGLFLDCEKTRT